MSTNSDRKVIESYRRGTHRYWRKADTAKPWFPWGLLQLLWLGLLFLFGALIMAPDIEADVRTEVAKRLATAGVESAHVATSGQTVSIHARASETNRTAVQTIADSTSCRTWAGNLPCPTTIDVTIEESTEKPMIKEMRPHQFAVILEDNVATLTGEVPSIGEQERLVSLAGQHFDSVANELVITDQNATANYAAAADGTIAAASHLVQGHAKWSGESLSVLGFANTAELDPIMRTFRGAGASLPLGEFNVSAADAPDQCNRRFGELLGNRNIRFETGSAVIGSGNTELLAELAEIAAGCAGKIAVEGHTDSRGDSAMNRALSQERANSVRDALTEFGVSADRLTAIGYGEGRPVADNSSAGGRAQNRRIAITIQAEN